MARTNPFSRGSFIALVSDLARDLGQVEKYAGFTQWVERVGLDSAAHSFTATLMRELASKEAKIAALEAKLASVSAEVVAWDRNDMAISAASAADAPVGRHAVKATPVWEIDRDSDVIPVIAQRTGLTAGTIAHLADSRNAFMIEVLPGGVAELATLIAVKAQRDHATLYATTGGFYARVRAGRPAADIVAWLTDSKRGA